jgi:peptidoglycan biosynthesis protein MviN/MurJ (putative lipid II flippase)
MRLAKALRAYSSLHADHRRIARGLMLGAIFVLIGRFAGAAKEMAVAWRYGVSGVVDAFQLASTLVGWLPTVVASVSGTVLVTALVRARTDDPQARSRFLGELNGIALAIGVASVTVSLCVGPTVVGFLATGLSSETRALAIEMSWQLAPAGALAVFITLFAVRLQARERHVNTLLDAVPATVLIVALFAWPTDAAGTPLIWGALVGATVHAAVLARLGSRADGVLGRVYLSLRSGHWEDIRRAAPVLLVGQIALSFLGPIDQFTATRFGDNAIATLGYANRIIALLVSLGALAIARAALPVFTDALDRDARDEARRRAFGWAWLMCGAGVVGGAIGWGLMPWAVEVLFERGAFTANDTANVSQIARVGLLQLPFYFGSIVMVQFLAASGRFGVIAASATVNLVSKVTLNLIAVQWFGLAGIMWATGGMYVVSFAFLMAMSRTVRLRAHAIDPQ